MGRRKMSPDKNSDTGKNNSDIDAVVSVPPSNNIVDLGIAQMRKKNLKSKTKQ